MPIGIAHPIAHRSCDRPSTTKAISKSRRKLPLFSLAALVGVVVIAGFFFLVPFGRGPCFPRGRDGLFMLRNSNYPYLPCSVCLVFWSTTRARPLYSSLASERAATRETPPTSDALVADDYVLTWVIKVAAPKCRLPTKKLDLHKGQYSAWGNFQVHFGHVAGGRDRAARRPPSGAPGLHRCSALRALRNARLWGHLPRRQTLE